MFVRAVEQLGGRAAAGTRPAAGSAISTQRTGLVVNAREPLQPEAPQASGSLTESTAGGAMTDQFGNPNKTVSGSNTVQGCQYVITQGTDPIAPGDTNIGSNCDECDTFIPLPFNFQLYGTTYNGVNVSSNGRLDFVNANEPGGFLTACLPSPPSYFTGLPYENTIFPLWQDMRTDATWTAVQISRVRPAASSPQSQAARLTASLTSNGARLYWDETAPQIFEVRLYENDPNGRFDVVFGTLTLPFYAERAWVSGVQGNGNLGIYTEDFCVCWPDSLRRTSRDDANPLRNANAITNTTPTATPTSTPRPTPTPRGSPIPRVRPTPHPRP
jgi:hypothetical protein